MEISLVMRGRQRSPSTEDGWVRGTKASTGGRRTHTRRAASGPLQEDRARGADVVNHLGRVRDEDQLEPGLVADAGELGEKGLDLADGNEIVGLVEAEQRDVTGDDEEDHVEHDQHLLAVRERV